MIIQPHRVHVGEKTREEIIVHMAPDAKVLHVHHYGLPHGYVEIVEMHSEEAGAVLTDRKFIVVDSFCSGRVEIPQKNLHFINAIPFDNHVWAFFEIP